MKILVADDDKEIVELISIYLHNEGYEAVKAYDGKEAMEYVRSTPDIGLLILDIMMPELDGMQVVKALRKESQIPIIMLTAKLDKRKQLIWIKLKGWLQAQMIILQNHLIHLKSWLGLNRYYVGQR